MLRRSLALAVVVGGTGLGISGCGADGPETEATETTRVDGARSDAAGASSWQPFGVLTLNLHCLKARRGFASNRDRFAAIARAVAGEGVAVMLVQEACKNGREDTMALLADSLRRETGVSWSYSWSFTHVAWAGSADEADEGIGVLVRGNLTSPEPYVYRAQGLLGRMMLGVTLPAELGGFKVFCTHLEYENGSVRVLQARETSSMSLVDADPSLDVVIGGDFNSTAGSGEQLAIAAQGFRDLTANLDSRRIDYIHMHRGARAALDGVAYTIFDGREYPVVSDHQGVVVRLKSKSPAPVAVTRIFVHKDVGWGNNIFVRGDAAPLTWSYGWPVRNVGADLWKIVLTEIPAGHSFEYKAMRNDTTWQDGGNARGVGGVDNHDTPTFY